MPRQFRVGPDIDLDEEVVLDSGGRRITEADAQRIVEETLDGLGRGRPSLTAPGTHSPEVRARVPAGLRNELNATAKRVGKTPSQVVREALERHLAERRA